MLNSQTMDQKLGQSMENEMKDSTKQVMQHFYDRYPALECCKEQIDCALDMWIRCYLNERKILTCGNGGSAADAQHIVGELMKAFNHPRRCSNNKKRQQLQMVFPEMGAVLNQHLEDTIPAISLVGELALQTAFSNDRSAEFAFAQSVYGLGKPGDILIAISTSGNSKNIVYAAQVAKALGLGVIAMTGKTGGCLKEYSDVAICIPSTVTYEIQEYHLPVYHALCLAMENELFNEES